MFDICRKRERVSFTSVQQKIDHMSPVGNFTERESGKLYHMIRLL